jgi:ribosomal protein RSM22 (predicted rRNA methylase)
MMVGNRRSGLPSRSRIRQGLVGARRLIGTRYLADPTLRSEYERDIAPRTSVALAKILGEIFPDPGASGRPRRVLDLAAGTGAAGAAVRTHFQDDIELVSVDQIPVAGTIRAGDVTEVAGLSRATAASGPFDLIVAAHVLNELYLDEGPRDRSSRIAALVGRWCQLLLADRGTLILLEPALRETSRALLGVRDHLLAAGLHIVAPCFFTGPCPALMRERDWCHDGRDVDQSTPSGRSQRRVDFSYLVVRSSGEATTDSSLFRIVSDPLPEKGRLKIFACGISGRHAIVRLDRHASAANADMDLLSRGDVARIVRTTFAQDGMRVVPETTITRQNRGGGAR